MQSNQRIARNNLSYDGHFYSTNQAEDEESTTSNAIPNDSVADDDLGALSCKQK